MRQWVGPGEIAALRLPGLETVDDVEVRARVEAWPHRDVAAGEHRRREWHVPGVPVAVRVSLLRLELRHGDPSSLMDAADRARARIAAAEEELRLLRQLAADAGLAEA